MTADLSQQFRRARKSGVPLLAVRTSDPAATIAAIGKIPANGNGEPPPILRWDVVKGITHVNKAGEVALQEANIHNPDPDRQEPTVGPVDALIAAERLPEKSILFFSNAHRVINELGVSQAIWNLRDKFKFSGRSLVLLCPSIELPAEIQQDVLVLDEPLPDFQALEKLVRDTFQGAGLPAPAPGDESVVKATDAICGLAAFPAEQVCAMSISKSGLDLDQLWGRKIQQIEQAKGLSVWRGGERYGDIGGYLNLKTFLRKVIRGRYPPHGLIFLDEIEKSIGTGQDTSGVSQDMLGQLLAWMQDTEARGVLLIGPPGVSKSMFAKATGNEAGVPTIAFDIGGMKGSHVGESEAAMRNALKVCDAVTQKQALVIGTCNNIESLPPELRRRFTLGIFFVDLPDSEERDSIWQLYEGKYALTGGKRPEHHGWTGAEIKQACALAYDLDMTMREAAAYIVPVAKSAAERIEKLRASASGRYISASYPGVYQKPEAAQSLVRRVEV